MGARPWRSMRPRDARSRSPSRADEPYGAAARSRPAPRREPVLDAIVMSAWRIHRFTDSIEMSKSAATSARVRSPRRATATTSRVNSGRNFFGMATSSPCGQTPHKKCQPIPRLGSCRRPRRAKQPGADRSGTRRTPTRSRSDSPPRAPAQGSRVNVAWSTLGERQDQVHRCHGARAGCNTRDVLRKRHGERCCNDLPNRRGRPRVSQAPAVTHSAFRPRSATPRAACSQTATCKSIRKTPCARASECRIYDASQMRGPVQVAVGCVSWWT